VPEFVPTDRKPDAQSDDHDSDYVER
jgi:hypothetical protein